jgi:Xaa-Pro aminopeptidase
MNSHFTAEFFRGNRAKLQSLFSGTAPIVITANGLMQRNSDTTFPFRQDSSFWYLTGIDEPDIVLVIDSGKEYLIVPERETAREAFDGQLDVQNMRKRSGIDTVLPEQEGWKKLSTRLKRVKHVATFAAPPAFVEALGIYTNPARQRLINQLKGYNANLEVLDLRDHMTRMRVVKQESELAAIQAAIDITTEAINEVRKQSFVNFASEYEVEAALTAWFRKRKAGHGYVPIVASGHNACTLHYVHNNDELRDGKLLLLDIGAEVENYSADITRTYAVGKTAKRQRAVHTAVLEVQKYAMSLLKPGIIIKEYEKLIEQYMGEQLIALGLITAINRESVRQFYPHATSHFLGLDVHDVGDYEKPLESGMVLTVEPGIYIQEEGIGVRLEDDVLVTENGIEVLSHSLPLKDM